MRNFFRSGAGFFLGMLVWVCAAGCAPVIIGALAVGAVGGYVVSPDTVEGTSAHSVGESWDMAKEITGIMGVIQEENERAGQIIVLINGSRVQITLVSINSSSTRISVKARKSFMPKVDLAQDVYTKIVNGMEK